MNNVLGSFWNPYSYPDYEEEWRNHTWNGGWVFIGSNHDKIYITTNGLVEQKEGADELGSEENPFSLTAYNEMFGNHTWIGGYVQEEDDCVYYPPQEDESGCGCGEGCGCGCGGSSGTGGLLAGNETYHSSPLAIGYYFDISWGAGSFLQGQGPQPQLSVTLMFNLEEYSYKEGDEFLTIYSYSWDVFYVVKIELNIYNVSLGNQLVGHHVFYYNIPGHYRM